MGNFDQAGLDADRSLPSLGEAVMLVRRLTINRLLNCRWIMAKRPG